MLLSVQLNCENWIPFLETWPSNPSEPKSTPTFSPFQISLSHFFGLSYIPKEQQQKKKKQFGWILSQLLLTRYLGRM